MHGASEAGTPLWEHGHNLARVHFQCAADDKVIGTAKEKASALHPWPYLPFNPGIEDLREAPICQHGGADAAVHDACLGVRQSALFPHAGPQPFPKETQHSSLIDPLAPHLAQACSVDAVEVSTDICLHAPAHTLRHAPLAELVQCRMRAATLSNARRAVVEVLLVDRVYQQRDRALDKLVLERRLAERALAPVVLLDPDTLHGRCLIASTAETLMQVAPVLVAVFGIGLRRAPVNPWGAGLPRVALGLAQEVLVEQVGQGRKDPIGIAGGLRRNPLELWWDGW
jgi:hypothetical protein